MDISKIIQHPSPENEYHREVFAKKQIVLHHTASGGNTKQDIDYLISKDSPGKVHVPLWIDRDGTKRQAFSSKYWAPHLGVPTSTFTKFKVNNTVEKLHKESIAIELDSWGYLTKKGDKFYTWANTEVKAENVITYPEGYLGQKYYEKYYDAQIESLKELLIYLCDTYKITKEYQCNMWKVSADALSGKSGIWSHTSFRESGKWDCHPDPKLITMLKSLS